MSHVPRPSSCEALPSNRVFVQWPHPILPFVVVCVCGGGDGTCNLCFRVRVGVATSQGMLQLCSGEPRSLLLKWLRAYNVLGVPERGGYAVATSPLLSRGPRTGEESKRMPPVQVRWTGGSTARAGLWLAKNEACMVCVKLCRYLGLRDWKKPTEPCNWVLFLSQRKALVTMSPRSFLFSFLLLRCLIYRVRVSFTICVAEQAMGISACLIRKSRIGPLPRRGH